MTPDELLAVRAESLYEELGGDLCSCQNVDCPHWCEKCQSRIAYIQSVFARLKEEAVTAALRCSSCGGPNFYQCGCYDRCQCGHDRRTHFGTGVCSVVGCPCMYGLHGSAQDRQTMPSDVTLGRSRP